MAAISTSIEVVDVVLSAVVAAICYFGFRERNATLLTTVFGVALLVFAILFQFGS